LAYVLRSCAGFRRGGRGMYQFLWRGKKRVIIPSVLSAIRKWSFALLLLGTAVRAVLLAFVPDSGNLATLVFLAAVAFLVVLASCVEHITRRAGERPELRDVLDIRDGLQGLDRFREAARAARSRDELMRLFDAFVVETLSLACKAVRHSKHVRISVMIPSEAEEDDCLRIEHVHPSAPDDSVGRDLVLPLRSTQQRVTALDGIGAAGFAYRGGSFSVYVPRTKDRQAYYVIPDTNGELSYDHIGPIWVPDTPRERLKSHLACPIFIDGEDELLPWGVINYGSKRRDAFGGADYYVCAVFASLLAQAFSIANAMSGGLPKSSA